MAKTATTGFTEAFVHTDPFYRGTYTATLKRSASGSGVADAVVVRRNLVTNPNFETNANLWGGGGNASASIARSTAQAYLGSASLSLTASVAGNSRAYFTGLTGSTSGTSATRISVTAGQTYTFSAYTRAATTARSVDVLIEWYNSSNAIISIPESSDITNSTTGWTRSLALTAVAPVGAVTCTASVRVFGVAISEVHYIDGILFETGSSLLPYFDGTYADTYTGYTLTTKSWSGTANASTSTATYIPTISHKATQLRLGALTDFSFPYLTGGRFYLGAATVQRTATGSGTGTQSAARLIKRLRTATGSGTGTQTAARLVSKYRTATATGTGTQSASRLITSPRTATGTGTGIESAARLISRYRTAIGSGVGTESVTYTLIPTIKRDATGSGTGTSTTVNVVIKYATATGSGTGTSNNTIVVGVLRTAYGSGGATAGDNATGLLTAKRAASSSGTGTSSVTQLLTIIRTATGTGVGTSTAAITETLPRTATGTGTSASTASVLHTHIRTATGSGAGTATVIGARVLRITSTGSGIGDYVPAEWTKSHIFRVPNTSTYAFATRYAEGEDKLFAHTPQGIRAYNLYKLTDNTYQITDPRRPELIAKVYYGGHDIFLDDTEVAELTAAGYGASIT